MAAQQLPESKTSVRRLGPVPWFREGFRGLSVRAHADVPAADDPVILGARVRGVLGCTRTRDLDRILNVQLLPLGYVALLQWSTTSREILVVVTVAHDAA